MVSGDHDGLNAGPLGDGDGILDFQSGRVDHADHAKEYQVMFHFFRFSHMVDELVGGTQDTQGFITQVLRFGQIGIPNLAGHGYYSAIDIGFGGDLEQIIHGTFCMNNISVIFPIAGTHEFTVGIKRLFSNTREFFVQGFLG